LLQDLLLTSSRHVRDYLRKLLDAVNEGSLALTGMGLKRLPQDYFGMHHTLDDVFLCFALPFKCMHTYTNKYVR
jgi:hypothetical protein